MQNILIVLDKLTLGRERFYQADLSGLYHFSIF